MPAGMHEGKQFKNFRFTIVPQEDAPANEVAVHHHGEGKRTPAGFLSLDPPRSTGGPAVVSTVYVHPRFRGQGLAPAMWHAAGGTQGGIEHDTEHLTPMGASFANRVTPGGNPETGEPFKPSISPLMSSPAIHKAHQQFTNMIASTPGARPWHPGSPVPQGMSSLRGAQIDWGADDVPSLDDPIYSGAQVLRHPRLR